VVPQYLSSAVDVGELRRIKQIHTHTYIHNVTNLINALPGNSSVNAVQQATIDEAVFSMSSAPSSGGTTGLCNPFLSNGSVNTLPRK
jgi:hypothetical protein